MNYFNNPHAESRRDRGGMEVISRLRSSFQLIFEKKNVEDEHLGNNAPSSAPSASSA